ncbi:MAG: SMC family ATPase [Ktedonobacteraceae bacterium]
MLITRIELENIKSYRTISVDLRRGTTAINGANGAGKTTLVEAVGFALFGYLSYNQDQFVREGEKSGKVVIHLIGSDERPYTVERRCGTGSRWLIYDEEADLRLEQRADVLDKLHDLFGIERERALDSLFRDALGVPQGTFTAIFLDAASKRKQTFDGLLQIEDYKTAADNLLETQKYYREQIYLQQGEIQRLELATQELDDWHAQLKAARLLDEQQKAQNAEQSLQLAHHEELVEARNQQLIHLTALEHRYQQARTTHNHAQSLLHDRELQLQIASQAQQIVEENQADYQLYEQTQDILRQLRQRASVRGNLREQYAELKNTQTQISEKINSWQGRLAEVASARQKIVELAPLIEQQIELEQQCDDAKQKATRYEEIVASGKRLSGQLTLIQQEQERNRQRIAAIKPLLPLAEQLNERAEAFTQLRIQASERDGKQCQLQEKRAALAEKQSEREQTSEKLHRAGNSVQIIEEHRQEAEEMPRLQAQSERLTAQIHRLEGNIEGYARSRAQSAGGQCPLLNETCLNISKRGIVSLESYFENLLNKDQAQLARINKQQANIAERINQIKRFAEALNKVDQYIERRDLLADQHRRVEQEIARLESDIDILTQALTALAQIEQRLSLAEAAYKESKQADLTVRDLNALYEQVQQQETQIRQLDVDIRVLREEAGTLQGSGARHRQLTAELAELNDPRSQSRVQQSIIAREGHFLQQLSAEQARQQAIQLQLQQLAEQLTAYESLDSDLAEQEGISQRTLAGQRLYLSHSSTARSLPERKQAHQQQLEATQRYEQEMQNLERDYYSARAAFNQDELDISRAEVERLSRAQAALALHMQNHQQLMTSLEQKIATAEALLHELEAARKESHALEDLRTMTEQFRKLIKEAAPHVLKAMLADISAEANRIFGEILGDRSAQLSWKNDYEIILRRQGVDRSFAQLSGGEQMSAALSVRLALLKKLSTLNIAFFDEPTQSMDELRRMNLAEQIRRVRGFDQLIVISHDDTFEQSLDSLIRLKKEHGETLLVDEDGTVRPADPSGAAAESGPGLSGQPLQLSTNL